MKKCLSWGIRSVKKEDNKKRCIWSGVANVTFLIYSYSSFSLLSNAPASLTQKIRHCDTGVSRR